MRAETLWIPLAVVFGLVLALAILFLFRSCQQSEPPDQNAQGEKEPTKPPGTEQEGRPTGHSERNASEGSKGSGSGGDRATPGEPSGGETSGEGANAGSGGGPAGASGGNLEGSAGDSGGMDQPDSGKKDSSAGSGVFLGPSGSAHSPTKEDVQGALRQARRHFQRAQQHAREGQYGQAYAEALRAWQLLGPLSKMDPECRQLYDQVNALLPVYGERTGPPSSRWEDKPLAIENK